MGLRESLENIVFAGLSKNSDPLYLSNRRWSSRLKPLLILGIPCLALLVGVEIAGSRTEKVEHPAGPKLLVQTKAADFPNPKFDTARLEVLEVAIRRTHGMEVVGTVRNRSQQVIKSGRLALELQDVSGQFEGTMEAKLHQIEPGAVARFELPVAQNDSRKVLVTGITVE